MENNTSEKITDGCLWKGFHYVKLLLIIVVSTWLFKSCFFSIYYIPSGSMAPTLKPGNYVLVSKFPYNLRSPEYYPLTDIRFPAFSADGLGEVQQGDIMVFDLPLFPTEFHPVRKDNYIKRTVGLSGDTIVVNKDRYFLHGGKLSTDRQNFPTGLLKDSSVVAFVIPEKGRWIPFEDSIKLFCESIVRRDGNNITYDSGNVLVNGKQKKKYQVQQNYYFVRGDNTRYSSDSRSWGIVPQSNLIGRAELKIWPWPPEWL